MIRNYLKVAVRNFYKGRLYSIINVSGLAVGLAVFFFIIIFIHREIRYDQFHEKTDRIYRVATHLEMGGNTSDLTATYPPLAKALLSECPEVEKSLRVYQRFGKVFQYEDKLFSENVLYAGPEFFEVFSFQLVAGDPTSALKEKYQVILTPELVRKYFGEQVAYENVLGKSIAIDKDIFEVTGIVKEAPSNSHIQFKAIASIESTEAGRDERWENMNLSTYVLLHNNIDYRSLEARIPTVLNKYIEDYDKFPEQGIVIDLSLQPLESIHLHSNLQGELTPTGSMLTLYILGSIAVIVLILACVNFMNLSTARSSKRAREVGIRKVLGSSTRQLIKQFTLESVTTVGASALLALFLLLVFRHPLALVTGEDLPFGLLLTPGFLVPLVLFIIVLGIVAGSYPSFYLSSFNPVRVLKGNLRTGVGGARLRNLLVTLQFVISIVLITCTIIVQNQLHFIRSKKLGFDKENLLVVENIDKLTSPEGFLNTLKSQNDVVNVSSAAFKPIDDYDGTTVVTEIDQENRRLLNFNVVDYDYFETLDLEIVSGRAFSRERPSDKQAVILNEAAVGYLFGNDGVGKKIYHDTIYEVIGVVADFNFETLKNEVKPMMFKLREHNRFLHVRLAKGNHVETLATIEKLWKAQDVNVPFSYSFVDQDYSALFKEETKLGTTFGVFTTLAVFIACLGLLGLASYTAEQRTKEIGVRKVLGASISNVIVLLSRDFVRLVLVAVFFSIPITYYAMTKWLSSFAYRTDVSIQAIGLGALLTLLLALSIVTVQALRVAVLNPADTLKSE
jgi:putative ABC transport system permease protein